MEVSVWHKRLRRENDTKRDRGKNWCERFYQYKGGGWGHKMNGAASKIKRGQIPRGTPESQLVTSCVACHMSRTEVDQVD